MPSVLMLYGGEVDQSHGYFQVAEQTLSQGGIVLQSADISSNFPESRSGEPFSGVVISDYSAYKSLPSSQRSAIDTYCRQHDIGIYFLYVEAGEFITELRTTASEHIPLAGVITSSSSPILHLLKSGVVTRKEMPGNGRIFSDVSAENIVVSGLSNSITGGLVLSENGLYDGVRRVWNGQDLLDHWLPKLILLDGLRWLSHNSLQFPAERWLAVDIDDIFQPNYHGDVAQRTVKIQANDVDDMLAFQREVSAISQDDFKFALGFNANYFGLQVGTSAYDDSAGDEALVQHKEEFTWFDHFPAHEPATSLEQLQLEAIMRYSRTWADEFGVRPYIEAYAVSPYHYGMNPPYHPLYAAWKNIWNLEYAGLAGLSSAFSYNGIKVVPRYGCGEPCNSNVYSFEHISEAALMEIADRGLLTYMASNPFTIMMTHQSDFARDRVALFMLREALREFERVTNLRLRTGTSGEVAKRYGGG